MVFWRFSWPCGSTCVMPLEYPRTEYIVFRKSTSEYAWCGYSLLECAEQDLKMLMKKHKEPENNFEIHIFSIDRHWAGTIPYDK
jgi:hypothetical protein